MGRADHLQAQGQRSEAATAYRRAAELEAKALDLVPLDRPQTRGIIAVSSIALYLRSGDAATGIRMAHSFLAESNLPDFATRQLYELIDDFRVSELESIQGRRASADEFECVLDGPRVRRGVAAVDTVIEKIDQVAKLGLRVYEYLAGAKLRTSGPVESHLQARFEMLVAQPTAGSFKFRVRFATQVEQRELIEGTRLVQPEELSANFAAILDAAGSDPTRFHEQVEDRGYRDAFVKLVRDLAPTGKEVDRVEIHRLGTTVAGTTVLTPPMRKELTKQLKVAKPARTRETVRRGILRALNLNERWVALGGKTGRVRKCIAKSDEVLLEDVVERLVNKRVRVTGYNQRNAFYVTDIVEDDSN